MERARVGSRFPPERNGESAKKGGVGGGLIRARVFWPCASHTHVQR